MSNQANFSIPQTSSKLEEIRKKLYPYAGASQLAELPTKGLYYPQDHSLHNVESVEIKPMSAKEEDFLVSKPLLKKGVALDRVIQSLMIENVNPSTLLVGDKNAILLAIRISGFGSKYKSLIACPICGEQFEYEYDLDEVNIQEPLSADQLEKLNAVHVGGRIFRTTLPMTKLQVEFQLMIGEDEMKLKNMEDSKKKNKFELTPTIDFLSIILTSVDGESDKSVLNEVARGLASIDTRYLNNLYSAICPNIDMTSNIECVHCGEVSKIRIPMTTEFFWPER